MKPIRHLKETAELACFRRRERHETIEQAHSRIDDLEDLVLDLIDNIQDRRGYESAGE